jgi:hypothetical protein
VCMADTSKLPVILDTKVLAVCCCQQLLECQWQCEYINENRCGCVFMESVLCKNRVLEGHGLWQGANQNSVNAFHWSGDEISPSLNVVD